MLGALILAGGHQSRGNMGNADSGISGIHVLAAFASGAVCVHANFFGLNFHLDRFINFRRHEHAGKRSMATLGLIERRDTHQAVHANFADQQPISVIAGDGKGCRLQPCLLGCLIFVQVSLKALTFCPAQVHAQQHLRPVLRFSSACARMDGDDGVAHIILAGEQRPGFKFLRDVAQLVNFLLQLFDDGFAFARQIKVSIDV